MNRVSSRLAAALLCAAAAAGVFVLLPLSAAAPCWAQAEPPPPLPPGEAEPQSPVPPVDPNAPPAPPPDAAPPTQMPGAQPGGGGRYLLLPDISLSGLLLGHLANDRRDQERERFRLDEIELAVQGFVYPGVKLDTFTVFAGGEAVVEEAYLTFQNVPLAHLPLSAVVGRRKVPFGRVNQLHPHSWLYAVQPYVLSNLVSGESLTGDGGYLSLLLPTGKVFTQLDAGLWSQSESAEDIDAAQDPTQGIITSPGAGFKDKFGTARLLVAAEALGGSVEVGGSLAGGRGVGYTDSFGVDVAPKTLLSGFDLSYRRAGQGAKRLLLRGEYVRHRQKDSGFQRTTQGYYLFADSRLSPQNSLGIRYDHSGFPFADGRERAVSLIGTRSLTEQFYFRLHLIGGSRPGKKNFGEVWVEIVFGAGPHTHNLE